MAKITSFKEILEIAKQRNKEENANIISVAAAHDKHVIEAVTKAKKEGIADFVLVGDKAKIEQYLKEAGAEVSKFEIINEAGPVEACVVATSLVSQGKAASLMKGLVDTGVIIKAALDKEKGMTTGKKLSHLAAFELGTYHKLLFITDAAINIAPDVDAKRDIILNAVEALRNLGIKTPKVALLAAKEKVDEKMPVTMEYAKLIEIHNGGLIDKCILDGPLALDNAISEESVKIKGVDSPVGGDADILMCPSIEAGNILYKSLAFLAGAKNGGVVLGAKRPIVLTSRADSAESKLFSIALSVLF